ncbi:methylmalonyl Co-A mutase-associated GTPase MeaB [Rhodospirillum centenum]|uniref:Lao n=1 Tax=Rhodospirillum centenum (strain ATCC 51521 / SW) TaxID=414684 RepID=B6IVY8_RHOCS|nr:methylmalonyl Co-A mutase-associated GTPase MeaB [Rhodospirillum centenum]ACJ00462.1 Lao [Rhodospirillum centenum SW]
MSQPAVAADLAARIRAGERRALARAITLVESTRPDHRAAAEALLADLLPDTGRSTRIGITGVPGVGKSTFIEAFGLHVIGQGHKVAVLAIDPTSQRTGGSILGDKTRMEELSRHPDAFIRPSPAGTTLGGVARRTREAMLLVEAAGFDVVIVETVGVGQSETAVADMVDLFLLLLPPAGGDELQGIKKGIVELADLIVVNKADGDLLAAARRAVAEYRHALAMLRPASPHWRVPVLSCSAATRSGIPEVWDTVGAYRAALDPSGAIRRRRAEQARAWMWSEIRESLLAAFLAEPAVTAALPELEAGVAAGRATPGTAARSLLERFRSR